MKKRLVSCHGTVTHGFQELTLGLQTPEMKEFRSTISTSKTCYLEQVSQRGRFAWKLQWSQCTAQGTSVAGHPKVNGISMISNPPPKKVLLSWVSLKEKGWFNQYARKWIYQNISLYMGDHGRSIVYCYSGCATMVRCCFTIRSAEILHMRHWIQCPLESPCYSPSNYNNCRASGKKHLLSYYD